MKCTNQIKQLSLAALNYEDVHKSLFSVVALIPSLPRNAAWKHWRSGGFLALLPFVEQQSLYQEIYASTSGYPTDGALLDRSLIPALLCPSDTSTRVLAANSGLNAGTSFRLSVGDWPEAFLFKGEPSNSPSGVTTELSAVATIRSGDTRINTRGVFPYHIDYTRRLSDITDGLSNTILFSEHIIGSDGNKMQIKVGIARDPSYVPAGDDRAVAFSTNPIQLDRTKLRGTVSGNEYKPTTISVGDDCGQRWADPTPVFNGFSTIFPPNGPGGSSSAGGYGTARAVISPSSHHKGGVQVSRVDGSVSFVSETIDCGDPADGKNPVQSGESPYGVWGAMGSIAGGESKSL